MLPSRMRERERESRERKDHDDRKLGKRERGKREEMMVSRGLEREREIERGGSGP